MEEMTSSMSHDQASATGAAPSPPAASGPLFYRRPMLLSSQSHGGWRLKRGDLAFAAEANALPLMASEFAMASPSYPIVFGADDAAPLALVGLERNNLFLSDGRWSDGHYIPAYVRRYPFIFMRIGDPEGFALAVDTEAEQVSREGEEGAPLFENEIPSVATHRALEFCRRFAGENRATQAFAAALRSQGLLAARTAEVTLPSDRKLGITGFDVVDADRFAALPEDVVVDWHRKGWLALVSFHLASLRNFADLLSRQGSLESPRPRGLIEPR